MERITQTSIESFLVDNPKMSAIDVARELNCSEAEALRVQSQQVWVLPASALDDVMAEVRTWERVMVLVRNTDAVAEIEVPGDAWYRSGDWLNWIDAGYNLHLRVAATTQILGLVREGKNGPTYSFNLVNAAGYVFCRFYARTPAAQHSFEHFCQTCWDGPVTEHASHTTPSSADQVDLAVSIEESES